MVLTVPAIWNDSSKQFMREAAVKVYTFYFNNYNLQGDISRTGIYYLQQIYNMVFMKMYQTKLITAFTYK